MLKLIEIQVRYSCQLKVVARNVNRKFTSQSEPIRDSPILNISTFDSRGIAHKKKRQVRGDRRIRIEKELQGTSTYAWRRNEANKLMDFGDVVSANLPSEDVARKGNRKLKIKS